MKKLMYVISVVLIVIVGVNMESKDKKMKCEDGVCLIEAGVNSSPVVVKEQSIQESVIEVTADNFEAVVLKATKPVIIDFYATWCPPCKLIKPVYAELAKEEKDWTFAAIDVDQAPDIMTSCGVKAMPTFVVFKNGIQWGLLEGGLAKEQLISELKRIVNSDAPQGPSKGDLTQKLIMQICTKNFEGVKTTINEGADLNGIWKTPYGEFFPLKSAITSSTDEITDLLICSGASIRNDLEEIINNDVAIYLKSIETLKVSFNHAKNRIQSLPNAITQDIKLNSPELGREFIISMNDITKLKTLINSGANVNIVFAIDKIDITPIYFAIMLNNTPAIDLLIDSGASLQVEGMNDKGIKKSIELLIEEYMENSNIQMMDAKKRLNRILNK